MVSTIIVFVLTNLFRKVFYLSFVFSIIYSCKNDNYVLATSEELFVKNEVFVGSETCATCHSKEFKDWKGSHHDLSMQEANSESILGDFQNTTYTSKGITYNFFKKGNEFFVNTEGVGGKYEDYKITHAFGVYPLQQYLIEFPNQQYQCLLVAWDSEKGKWYDLQPDLEIHHTEWMHWTGGSMTWNNMCADCHSTNLKKNYDQTTKLYSTTYDIINVSCEACHGSGGNHIEYYKNIDKYSNVKPPKLYMDKGMDSKEVVQKCARCHSRRAQNTKYFNYEGHFFDHYSPQLLTAPMYELDGQIKDEVYVYGSFAQSKMYQEGVSCNDCHNPHTLGLIKTGNSLCLNCHTPNYNEPSHYFHEKGSNAAQCINCHMTGKKYMGNDYRRDHSFRVPRPDQTVKYGTPNACNSCHQDKDAQWAADIIVKNYGETRPEHFSDNLLDGYHSNIDGFRKVFSNTNNSELVRATALNRFGNNPLTEEQFGQIFKYVNDISPLVRSEAIKSLSKINSNNVEALIKPLLLDSLRLVRISAANYFKSTNDGVFMDEKNRLAESDYNNELKTNADFASGQHKIAMDYHRKGQIEGAIKAYYNALDIDNYYNMSRINLALLEYNRGNFNQAEKLYLKVTEQEPNFSHAFYSLGLFYGEQGNPEKSIKYLGLACEKEPKMARAFYNYALKLQQELLLESSVDASNFGLSYFPNDENILYIKLLGLIKLNKKEEAKLVVAKLLNISPSNTSYLRIFNDLQS